MRRPLYIIFTYQNGLPFFWTLILLCLFPLLVSGSQVLPDQVLFKRISVTDGLSQAWVNDIIQDKNGFIWVGTEDGLNLFDGTHFKHFKHSQNQPGSLISNQIYCLLEDSRGMIWIGTQSGVSKLDPVSLKFTNFSQSGPIGQQLASDDITEICEDHQGRVWISAFGGITYWDPKNDKMVVFLKSGDPALIFDQIRTIICDPFDQIWVGTEKGIGRLNEEKGLIDMVSHCSSTQFNSDSLKVRKIIHDPEGYIWIGTYNGVFCLTPSGEQIASYLVMEEDKSHTVIMDIAIGPEGLIWVGTFSDGLIIIDPQSKMTKQIHHSPMNLRSLSHERAWIVLWDQSDMLWVGTSGAGLNLWNPKARRFKNVDHNPLDSSSLSSSIVWCAFEDRDGNIWVGTDNGLNLLLADGTFKKFQHDSDNPTSLSSNQVFSVCQHGDGRIWVGTELGLNLLDPETGHVDRFYFEPDKKNALSNNVIYKIQEDRDGDFWFATKGGLNRFDSKTSNFQHFLYDAEDPHSISNNTISTIYMDPEGQLWVGTADGLNRLRPDGQSFDRFLASKENVSEGNINRITCVGGSGQDKIWIGFGGKGMASLDFAANREAPVPKWYSVEDGLPNGNIFSLLPDANGNLWISSNEGLIRFHPETERFKVFHKKDGLLTNEWNDGSFLAASNGLFYFGGIKGLTIFDPLKIKDQTQPLHIHLTAFNTFHRELKLDRAIWHTSQIELSHLDYAFSIDFSALEFIDPDGVEYQVFMEGLDKDWIDLGHKRDVGFTNLDPGEYQFQVRARRAHEEWSNQKATLTIRVLYPPLLSPLAYVIYFLAFSVAAGWFMRSRIMKSREKKRAHLALIKSEARLQLSLWASGNGMWDWDAQSDSIYRTHYYDDLRYLEDEKPKTLREHYDLVHPDDLAKVKKNWSDHILGNSQFFQVEYRVHAKSGDWVWFRERGKIVGRDNQGKALRVSGTHMNISNIKASEDQLTLFAKALENTLEGVLILNDKKEISAVNKAFVHITGYKTEEVLAKGIDFLPSDEITSESYQELWDKLETRGEIKGEILFSHKNGKDFPVWLNATVLKDESDRISHYVGVFSDITQRKKKEKELSHLANYDVLTQLPNRTLLNDRIEHAIQHAHRTNSLLATFFLDLDEFKQINDKLGYNTGDKLLILVAERLKDTLRAGDTVARIGGDEFVILLEDITEIRGLAKAANEILDSIGHPFTISEKDLHISPSIGISVYPHDGKTAASLLKYAETAMYHAKEQGRNNFQFFTEEMNQRVLEQIEMGQALRKALNNNELVLYYQPQIDLPSGKIVGIEALLRWEHPEKGLITPLEFISIAENTGLILPIGEWVCQQAILQGVKWRDLGLGEHRICINISARQFHQFDIVGLVNKTLKQTGYKASLVELEITETTIINDIEQTTQKLKDLRGMGVRLAVDDFGTGYCSLSYLKQFPLDSLKIDKSFIDGVSEHGQDSKIVSSVILLAHDLGLEVIAEGVETDEHIAFLRENHCDAAQGYYFARPQLPENLEQLLSDNQNLK